MNRVRYKLVQVGVLLACGFIASCGVPTKKFRIDAIDEERRPIKCLIVLDCNWPTGDSEVHYTPSEITIPFDKRQVRIQVKPAQLDAQGNPVRVPTSTDETEFRMAERDVEIRDPSKQLFILVR
jgi:hypothetical protein